MEPATTHNHAHTTTTSGPITAATATTTTGGGDLSALDASKNSGTIADYGTSTTNENLTRVITSENKNDKKKDDRQFDGSEKKKKDEVVDESMLLTGKKLALAHTGFLLAMFCVALDQTIVATALPKLASQFNALDQLTWVVSAYFLTQAGLMLTFGQILTIAPSKWVYFTCILQFEIGSLICAVAQSMDVLIFGRAYQGIGASGIFVSIYTILSQITRLEQRPLLFGTFGGIWGIASVIGPLLGGVLTDRSTWRWCFYINLPFGAISLATVLLFQPTNPPPPSPLYTSEATTIQKWLSLDWIGSFLSLATIVCLLLPLQWGGVSRPWNDKIIIVLFVLFAILLFAFLSWEKYKGKRAMMPLRLLRRRTQLGASLMMFFMLIPFFGAMYYLPLFYQAKGRTAAQSGIDIVPFMVGAVAFGFVSGGIVNVTGHYLTMMVVGPLLAAVASGLFFTVDEQTSNAKLIGYQFLFGTGLGFALQLPVVTLQAEYAEKPELIPQATSLLTFLQLLGGVVGIAIAGTMFNNQLTKQLSRYLASSSGTGILTQELIDAVTRSITAVFEPGLLQTEEQRTVVVKSYMRAIDYTFIPFVPACVLTSASALLIKNWNLKQRGGAAPAAGGGGV
ncbi:hypothetical protein FRB91_010479 [Serendipita sp. 411]|nr:hypothetical protein FRB91_010479 [Serendipita sp. 411]